MDIKKKGVFMGKKTLIFMFGLIIILFIALPKSANAEGRGLFYESPEEKAAQIQAKAQKEVAQTQKEAAQTSAIAIIIGGAIIAVTIIAVNQNRKDSINSKPIDITAEGELFCSKCGKKLSVDDAFCSGCGTKIENLNT